ncbi:MAG: twin-arginine translocation pathway signal protein, partial [Proteobacteria bacterium]|nr:twin-arginine translocation pathway signal protein [Pseudomonadota bacterium]
MGTRRRFLKIIGGSAIIAAAGGIWAVTRDPKSARVPWSQAGQLYDDPIRNALSYAILAPNPHNRQPWLVDLKSDHEAVLYCQLDRRLPKTDPFNRQITIGLGCFLEIARIAASSSGYSARITPFPEGTDEVSLDARPVAHILLEENNTAADPLFSTILKRHTDRSAYDLDRPVATPTLEKVLSAGIVEQTTSVAITEHGMITDLRNLTWRAWVIETETPQAHMESVNLMRIGRSEIEAQPDGLALGGPMLEALNT